MKENFEIFSYFDHLRRRVLFLVVTCGTAVLLALGVSFLVPRKYTATARILIDPPAGSDQRTTINPVYLESLKTYQLLASSDHLFLQAAERFRLRGAKPINQLERSILKVAIPQNTRILEISATLPDAKTAQAFALYLAQQTVELSRFSTGETERDLVATAQQGLDHARNRMQDAEGQWEKLARGPVNQTASRAAQIDIAQTYREAARDAFEAAARRAQNVQLGIGYRGDRLTIVDPGVIPARPSSPNIPLNVVAALAISLAAALFYLALDFNNRLRAGFSVVERERYSGRHRAG